MILFPVKFCRIHSTELEQPVVGRNRYEFLGSFRIESLAKRVHGWQASSGTRVRLRRLAHSLSVFDLIVA
jgi:hypothetical protein